MSSYFEAGFAHRHTGQDMEHLRNALETTLAPLKDALPGEEGHRRLLNLACGRADETGVLANLFQNDGGSLEIVGADLRAPEIDQARSRWKSIPDAKLQTSFHAGDGLAFLDGMSANDQFDIAFLRHQNFWNGGQLWQGMFDRSLERLSEDGLLVITSYFDLEHQLACQALQRLGADLVSNHKNPNSRRLTDAPGKSVDRHIAVFRKPPSA